MNILIGLFWIVFYLNFQVLTVYGGDGGDFASACYLQGIPHPPGFPLYTAICSLLVKLPLNTVAWRVALLSSVSSALTLFILYLLFKKIFNNNFSGLLATLILGFSYPFWLYAITVEVYALNLLFSILLVFTAYLWSIKKSINYLYLFILLLGFALAHHQLILFLFPGFIYWFYLNKKYLPKINLKFILSIILLGSVGFLSYGYAYFAAQSFPSVSWNNPYNLTNLIRLASKASYGYVFSGASYGQTIQSRLIGILAYFSFISEDFRILGLLFIVLGIFKTIISKNKLGFFFLVLLVATGPLLYFYASFYLNHPFKVAIFEQFLSFSYIFLVYFIVLGLLLVRESIIKILNNFLKKNNNNIKVLSLFINFILLIYPLSLFYINYPKLSVLKNDFTAERFADDILKTPEKQSVLFLARDTALFDTQYVYFTKNARPDVLLLHYDRFMLGEYRDYLKKYYPDLKTSDLKEQKYLDDFINDNYDKHPFYANFKFNTESENYRWIRIGLLYRLYKKNDLPDKNKIIEANDLIWGKYNDPLIGSLGKYQNLYQSNILSFYSESHQEYATYLLSQGFSDKAIDHLKQIQKMNPEDPENYFYEAQANYYLKNCAESIKMIDKAISLNKNIPMYFLFKGKIYQECIKDDNEAKKYYQIFEEMMKDRETPLKKL